MTHSENKENPSDLDRQNADDENLNDILRRHLPWLQSVASKKLGCFRRSKGDTGDIVQEAIVQFLKYGPRVQLSNDEQLRALLYRIVENTIKDQHAWFTAQRRAIAKERPLPPDTMLNLDPPAGRQETPSQIVQQHEDEAWARLGLELLDADERKVIILHYWRDLSFHKIAEKLGISKSGAYQRYLHAMCNLVEKIQALQSGRIDEALGQDFSEENGT
ncbi:MAG: RNA polymerase sigma factor [Planctomycetota bacterium]